MRDGAPLPGRTPAHVLSQLAYRVFGPLQPTRTRIVLDYHGLLDNPAGPLAQIAGRHRVATRTVSNDVSGVRVAGTRLSLSASLIVQATRASVPGDDHLGRVRIAGSLGLPATAAAAVENPTPVAAAVPAGHLTAARAAAGARRGRPAGPADLGR